MILARLSHFILTGFRFVDLWNMPETRPMATPQVGRRKAGTSHRPVAFPKLFFSRAGTTLGLLLLAMAIPSRVMACAACFGQSDSDMARGMNAGIFTLLLVVGAVLIGFAAFFIFLVKRSARRLRLPIADCGLQIGASSPQPSPPEEEREKFGVPGTARPTASGEGRGEEALSFPLPTHP